MAMPTTLVARVIIRNADECACLWKQFLRLRDKNEKRSSLR